MTDCLAVSFWQLFYSVGSFIAYCKSFKATRLTACTYRVLFALRGTLKLNQTNATTLSGVNYACSHHTKTLGEWDWKMVVIFQMLVPLIILAQLPFLPETQRWYIQHGDRIEDARRSLLRVRESEQEVEDEILAIREAIVFEKEDISSSYMALWKDASVRKRLLLAFVINVGQQLSGQGTLNSYSSTIYKKVFTSTNTINLINALNATCGIIFTLNATWTVDRFGRKFLFIGGAIGMAMCMLVVPLIGMETPTLKGGTKTEPVRLILP
jgi:MFS family permease